MARLAIILHEGSSGPREDRLSRVLDFFGVPWKMVEASEPAEFDASWPEYAVFGSIRTIASKLKQYQGTNPPKSKPNAFYAYTDEERTLCANALQSMFGGGEWWLKEAPAVDSTLCVSNELADVAGSMAGLKFSSRLTREDTVLSGIPSSEKSKFASVISAGDAQAFLRLQHSVAPIFLCTNSHMIDIDQPVREGFYDVKGHFCSVVPLVMFIRFMFQDVAWRPQEIGACLIIDDPLLKAQYGFCNFAKLRDLMRAHGFTTNIAFIPWNWRRTSPAAREFFGNDAGLFSISIHGCDHTAREFGATSPNVLDARAQLAQSRMRNHDARTGIQHDCVMVFPQGVFSSGCPEVLKRNGFLAAVNTEINPADSQNARTRIRDAWDVAIMSYDNFPIFTRRYGFHGIENFAFDLLLGKPCLIVAHHNSFKDGGVSMVELIEKIKALNCRLHWRPLGQVIQRACRLRIQGEGTEELEMYGNELLVGNSSDRMMEVIIRKRTSKEDSPFEVQCDERPIRWEAATEHFVFGGQIPPHSEKQFRVVYQKRAAAGKERRTMRFELAVAARRILSEFRDGYLS